MRPFALLTAVLIALGAALPAAAQEEPEQGNAPEGGWLDIGGGVRVPVPRERRTQPDIIAPGDEETASPSQGNDNEGGGIETVHGRQAGRTTVNAEGEEVPVFQSSRVSGVEQSITSRDRFNWFYAAQDVYYGIIPHIRDTLPHIARFQERGAETSEPNEITWIGFQAFPEYTRVFIQLARFPSYTAEELENGSVLTLIFDNTRIPLTNFSRFVDTSYFDRSVDMIDAETLPNGRARVLIWRDELAPYAISLDGNYVYIDFQDTGARRRPAAE